MSSTSSRPFRKPHVNLLLGIRRTAAAAGVDLDLVSLELREVNHEPALLIRVAGRLDSVYGLAMDDDAIAAVRVVRNPDKLAFIDGQLEAGGIRSGQ